MNESTNVAYSWIPSSPGGVFLLLLIVLAVSWWITGRLFKERDLTTMVFRSLISLLLCFAIGLFQRSLVGYIHEGPLAPVLVAKTDPDKPLQNNMRQWVATAAYEAYWKPAALDPKRLQQMSPAERKEYDDSQVTSDVLVESAVRGLIWMAMEHRQPSLVGRNAFLHAERGTQILNRFTPAQAHAMYDFVVQVSPRSEGYARPYLADALAYCAEVTARPGDGDAAKPAPVLYPRIDVTRMTPQGRVFVVRMSPTETRVIEAGSEEEALKKATELQP
jgi:hypothetical protein